MRLRHIEVFNAVMLTGSVSEAARLINVTQPAVSRTLQHAEIQAGFKLFERVRNRLVPTAEAQALYPHVRQLFGELDRVRRLTSTLRDGAAAGELRVAAILALGHEVLPRALTLFRKRFPQAAVTFRTLHSPEIVSSLLLHESDLGFMLDAPSHPGLLGETLSEGELVCVAAPGVLPARSLHSDGLALAELARLPLIRLEAGDPLGATFDRAAEEAGLATRSSVTVQTYHAALALALHGHGVAVVDSVTALSAPAARVQVLPLRPRIAVGLQLLRAAGRPASVMAQAFARSVQQVLEAVGHLSPGKAGPPSVLRSRKPA